MLTGCKAEDSAAGRPLLWTAVPWGMTLFCNKTPRVWHFSVTRPSGCDTFLWRDHRGVTPFFDKTPSCDTFLWQDPKLWHLSVTKPPWCDTFLWRDSQVDTFLWQDPQGVTPFCDYIPRMWTFLWQNLWDVTPFCDETPVVKNLLCDKTSGLWHLSVTRPRGVSPFCDKTQGCDTFCDNSPRYCIYLW